MNLISGYESFARAILGVLQMDQFVEWAAKAQVPFATVRDAHYDHLRPDSQEALQALARHLDGLPRVSQMPPLAEVKREGNCGIFVIPGTGEI